jgi:hypothetical protein
MSMPIQEEPESTVGRKPPRRPASTEPAGPGRARSEPPDRRGAAESAPAGEPRERERTEPPGARGHEG